MTSFYDLSYSIITHMKEKVFLRYITNHNYNLIMSIWKCYSSAEITGLTVELLY